VFRRPGDTTTSVFKATADADETELAASTPTGLNHLDKFRNASCRNVLTCVRQMR